MFAVEALVIAFLLVMVGVPLGYAIKSRRKAGRRTGTQDDAGAAVYTPFLMADSGSSSCSTVNAHGAAPGGDGGASCGGFSDGGASAAGCGGGTGS
jgi:hypothetical protein